MPPYDGPGSSAAPFVASPDPFTAPIGGGLPIGADQLNEMGAGLEAAQATADDALTAALQALGTLLDASLYAGMGIFSDGVEWSPRLAGIDNLAPGTLSEVKTSVLQVVGTPASYKFGWFTGRDGYQTPGGTSLAGFYQRPICTPLWLPAPTAIDDIGLSVLGAGSAGTVLRLGVSGANTQGYPATYLSAGNGTGAGPHDFGTVLGSSTGAKGVGTAQFGDPIVIGPGLYFSWVCWQGTNGTPPTIRSWASSSRFLVDAAVTNLPPDGELAGWCTDTTDATSLVTGNLPNSVGPMNTAILTFGPRVMLRSQPADLP